MTRSVFILHPGKANYPEVPAYSSHLAEWGFRVASGTLEDFERLPDRPDTILWAIMGFYRQDMPAAYVIHDYRSLSVGRLVQLKDLAKRYLNAKPNLRIFQNDRQRQLMRFNDGIPSILLPMGIPDWIFKPEFSAPKVGDPIADFCYIGDMSRERHFDMVLKAFERSFANSGYKLMLIGQPEPQIHAKFGSVPGIHFAGRFPQQDALRLVARSRAAICYFPYHRPHCYQTPTKLLEYAALGKPIICNDAPANLECCKQLNIESIVTGADIFGSLTGEQLALAKPNDRERFKELTWQTVINRSGIQAFLR
ncbi:glycosyltransferase [Cupriavidus oxalaticus]|uniref:Glycosyltransferase n=1 Tax=Cupriavidus oxalaticus TaxID=96344 RepID=A0A4P7LRX3_9BURK|nr:glycosyltransferase [Cupriavidus oxalaticus]QBY55517.1 glycosyltransferase [Cupriavidus oxalaticus]